MQRRTSLVMTLALIGALAGGMTAMAGGPMFSSGVESAVAAAVIGQKRGDDRAQREAQRRASEARQRAASQRRAQEARQRANAQRRAQEARQRADAQRRAQEARQRADAQRRAQEARQRADAQRRAQEARQRADAQRRAQEARQRADAQRRAQDARQRADAQRRAQDARQRADSQRRAQDARRNRDVRHPSSSDTRRIPDRTNDIRRTPTRGDDRGRDIRRPASIDRQNDRARQAEAYRRQLQQEHLRRRLEAQEQARREGRDVRGPSAPPTLIYKRGETPTTGRDIVNDPLGSDGAGARPLFGKGLSDESLADLNDERRRRRMQQQLGGAPIGAGGFDTGVGTPVVNGGDDPVFDPPPPGPEEGGLLYEYDDDDAVYVYNNTYYEENNYYGWSGWGWNGWNGWCDDWYGYDSGWSFSIGYSSGLWGFSFGYSSYSPYYYHGHHHHHHGHHHHHWKPSWYCWSGYKPYYWHTPVTVYHYSAPVVYWPKTTYVAYQGYDSATPAVLLYESALPDINDGWEALRFGELDDAYAVFDELTFAQPTAAAPRIGLSLTKSLELDHAGAVLEMRRAFTDDPTAAYLVPGDTRMKDVISIAMERYVTQVRIDRSDVDALFMIGALNLLRQDFPEGYYAVDAAIRSGDEHVSAYNLRTELDKAMFNRF